MTTTIRSAVGGKFKIEAIRPDGTRRVLADWFDNLILNSGLDRIMSDAHAVGFARVGSGSTAPAPSDLALETQIASSSTVTSSVVGNASTAPYYGWCRRTYRFAAGVAAGSISEVGIGWGATGSTLFSRALVLNSVGDPITLTVLSDEVLDVTYELRLYAPTADVTFSFVLAGTTHDCTLRASKVTAQPWQPLYVFNSAGLNEPTVQPYSGAINALVTGSPSGTATSAVRSTASAYTAGTFTRAYTVSYVLNDGNFGAGGIQSLLIESLVMGTFQCSLTPAILKDANKLLTLDFTYTIARYTP